MGAYTTMNALERREDEQVVEDFAWYLLHSSAAQAFPEGIYDLTGRLGARPSRTRPAPRTTPFSSGTCCFTSRATTSTFCPRSRTGGLRTGGEIRIERAPTHFGEVGLVVRGTPAGVDVEWRGPDRLRPRSIILHLPETRRLVRPVDGLKVVYRRPQSKRWDFDTVVGIYEKTAPPLF